MLSKHSLAFQGLIQSTALLLYIMSVAWFITFISSQVSDDSAPFYGPIVMLLLFVMSAVISGSIVLGRAGVMYMQKQQAQAYKLIGWTVLWSLIYFGLFTLLLLI